MTLSEMISAAKRRFRDTANDVVKDPQWVAYLNQAYKEFLFSADFLIEESVTTIVVTTGAVHADLPPNTLSVLAVRDVTRGGKLVPLDGHRTPSMMFPNIEELATGHPDFYRAIGTKLYLYPRPDATTTLEITHRAEPPNMTGPSNVPILPLRFHYAIVDGALGLAHLDDHNLEMAAGYQERMNGAIRAAINDMTTRRGERMPQLVDDFYGE